MDIVYPGHSKFRYNSLHNTQYVADDILTKLFLKVHEELKGTVQWNFRPLVIFIIRTHLSHWTMGYKKYVRFLLRFLGVIRILLNLPEVW